MRPTRCGRDVMLLIDGARTVCHDHVIESGAVLVAGGAIAAIGPSGSLTCPANTRRIDGRGLVLAPGFIETQINGALGMDLTSAPQSIWPVGEALPRFGVTSFLPTIVSSPAESARRAREVLTGGAPSGFRGAKPIGLHLEGPFLNLEARGAHDAAHLRAPTLTAIEDWSPAAGVAMVTLAPELPGALAVIEELARRDVVVAAGHSRATYDVARAALRAGVRHGTHLFNAMGPLGHREPGLVGALLDDPDASVGLIVDGVHVHPAMVRLAHSIKGSARIVLVTDAIAALGMGAGSYRLGEVDVEVGSAGVRLRDGTLAGSAIEPTATVRNRMAFTGCSLDQAIAGWTSAPARLLELSRKGRIAPGFDADLVLLTEDLDVCLTIIEGDVVFVAEGHHA